MRALQVYRDYFTLLPGGIERHVHELAHGLRPQVETEVLVSARDRKSTTFLDGDVPVHLAAELVRFEGVPLCPTFPKQMAEGDYDVIHLHAPNPTGEIASRVARTPATRVATYHATTDRGGRARHAYERLLLSTLRRCSHVLVSSEQLIDATPLLERLRREESTRIEVVPFGVDIERFHPGETAGSRDFQARWGPGPIVLFLGRLRYYKGLEHLIHAIARLDVRLVMIGDGLERARIERLAQETLGERLVYYPVMTDPEIPDAYRAADVFVLPSTSSAEAFGLSALEAMASGTPVVTTEVGTATSVINQDGVTGSVIPPSDADAIAGTLQRMLGDSGSLEAMGKAARARVEEHYDRRAMFQKIRSIYEAAVEMNAR